MSTPSLGLSDAAGAFALREVVALEVDPYAGLAPTCFPCPACQASCKVWVSVEVGEDRYEGQYRVEAVLHTRTCAPTCEATDQDIRDHAIRLISEKCDYCKRLSTHCCCP